MKLLAKTNKYYFIFLLFLSPIMIAIDYLVIDLIVNREINEILIHDSERIKYYIDQEGEFPSSNYNYEVNPISENLTSSSRFSDTLVYEKYTKKILPYRKYDFTAFVGDSRYRVSLRHVLLETNELIAWLLVSTVLILILLLSALFFINQKISQWVWKPFYRNLLKLQDYDITKKYPVKLEDSGITEFKALSKVIATLMAQVEKDFQNLKEFNENISHEMQTPLAIIRNKMVVLLESQNISEKDLMAAQTAYQEVNKLSKIGKSLTLISKIENQELKRLDDVDLSALVQNILNNMEDISNFKDLEITVNLDSVKVKCDPTLANILFTNLIKNAIQHNQEGGSINVMLNSEKFVIENTGEVLEIESEQLFSRFQRGNRAKNSLGLGLAINQKICELYGFSLTYEYQINKHKFSLFFNC